MTRPVADGSSYTGTAIDPSGIPLFDGDLVAVEAGALKFRTAAWECKNAGTQVHSRFQGLEGCYHAPERWELLSSTAQVRTGGVSFGRDLEEVGEALADYVQEMRPVADNLQSLFLQAVRFRSSIEDEGEDWDRDKDAVGQNNGLVRQVSAQVELKAAIERRCANRIEALLGGRQWHAADEPGKRENAYGYDDIPDDADTPWGKPADWEAPWEHGLLGAYVSFEKGIWIDGVGGTLLGLNQLTFNKTYAAALMALTGMGSWAQVGEEAKMTGLAWAGLGKGVAGVALWTNPIITPFVGMSHALGVTPGWVKACEESALDMGKGIIAWDTWKDDPARAAGATVFNVGTFFLPGGEASTVAKLVKGGARGAGEAGLIGKLAGHVDDGPPVLIDDVPGVRPVTPGSLLPDGAAAAGKLPSVDDLARTAGRDARPHLPHLDDPIAARVDDPPPARTAHGGHDSPPPTRLPDAVPEPAKELVGTGGRRGDGVPPHLGDDPPLGRGGDDLGRPPDRVERPPHPDDVGEVGYGPGERLEVPDRFRNLPEHQVDSGESGAWRKELNNPKPDSVYVVDDQFMFVTDHAGRVNHVEGWLDYDPRSADELGKVKRNGYQQRVAGREWRLEVDEGGHLIATKFGGPGERINLVPMDRALNGAGKNNWWNLEHRWLGLRKAGHQVHVKIDPEYPGQSKRPEAFDVEFRHDGRLEQREFIQ